MCTKKPGSSVNPNESAMENGKDHLDKRLNGIYTFASCATLGKSFTFSASVSVAENWSNTSINL